MYRACSCHAIPTPRTPSKALLLLPFTPPPPFPAPAVTISQWSGSKSRGRKTLKIGVRPSCIRLRFRQGAHRHLPPPPPSDEGRPIYTTLSSSRPSGIGPFWNLTLTELTQCRSFVGVMRSPSNCGGQKEWANKMAAMGVKNGCLMINRD